MGTEGYSDASDDNNRDDDEDSNVSPPVCQRSFII